NGENKELFLTHHAEAAHHSIRQPPHALGIVGVFQLPVGGEGLALRTGGFFGFFGVIAAAEIAGFAVDAVAPFAGVAEHVIEAPGVGLFGFHLVGLFFGIFLGPGGVVGSFGHIAAGAAGVFPFGDGGETVFLIGFLRKPFAIHLGGKMGGMDHGPAIVAPAAVGGIVGRAGPGFGGRPLNEFLLVFGEIE